MKVLKFGGTSVGSASRMHNVAELISDQDPKIVVLSAMSGTTNQLLEISSSLSIGNQSVAQLAVEEMRKRYKEVSADLLKTDKAIEKANSYINNTFDQLSTLCALPYASVFEKIIVSKGELLSTHLFSFYLEETGINHILLDALSFMKIDAFQEPDKAFMEKALNEELGKYPDHSLFITQGYICKNHINEIDNLKRGGSDYSASLMGEAISASEIQIWTDIDGLHNNDPRYVENTQPIRHISFDEAAELAYFGAKILHPASIQPAKNKKINVWLKNTLEPKAAGTLIDHHYEEKGIKSIAAKDGITAIKIKSTRMLLAYGFLRKVFEVFEQFQTSIDMITTSEVAISLTIDNDAKLDEITKALQAFGEIEVDKNQTIVCIVGHFIAENSGMGSKIFEALQHIPLRMISYGGSRHNISILINQKDKVDALKALHVKLF